MNTFEEWARQYPEAHAALAAVINHDVPTVTPVSAEALVQQKIRLELAKKGVLSWRNNVGATPVKCQHCGAKNQPVRYGLANDSAKLNKRIKSSDLILSIPRKIRPQDVGKTIAQFGAVECKAAGWRYSGKGREAAQAAWLTLIEKNGGFATFSSSALDLLPVIDEY
jgi:hypothetical protein